MVITLLTVFVDCHLSIHFYIEMLIKPFVWWVGSFIYFVWTVNTEHCTLNTDQQRRTNGRNEKFISDSLEIHWKIVFIQLLFVSTGWKAMIKRKFRKIGNFWFRNSFFVRRFVWYGHNLDLLLAIVAEEKIFTIKYFMWADNTI